MKRLKLGSLLKYLIGLSLGVGLFYLAFRHFDFQTLGQTLQQVRWAPLVVFFLLQLAANLGRAIRWRMLLVAAGHNASVGNAFAALMVGYLANYLVPRMGEVTRCTMLLRSNRVPLAVSAGTVVNERILDVLVLLLMILSLVGLEASALNELVGRLQLTSRLPSVTLLLLLAGLGLVVLFGLYAMRTKLAQLRWVQALVGFLHSLGRAVVSIRQLRSPLLFILVTLGIWGAYWLNQVAGFWVLPTTANLSFYIGYVLLVLGSIGMAVPVPGGLGSYHNAIIFGFLMLGLPEGEGRTYAFLVFAFQLIANVVTGLGALAYLLVRFSKPLPTTQAEVVDQGLKSKTASS